MLGADSSISKDQLIYRTALVIYDTVQNVCRCLQYIIARHSVTVHQIISDHIHIMISEYVIGVHKYIVYPEFYPHWMILDVCLVDELGPAPRVAACHQSRRTAIKTEIYPGKTMQNVFSTTLLGKHVGSIQATALLSFLAWVVGKRWDMYGHACFSETHELI